MADIALARSIRADENDQRSWRERGIQDAFESFPADGLDHGTRSGVRPCRVLCEHRNGLRVWGRVLAGQPAYGLLDFPSQARGSGLLLTSHSGRCTRKPVGSRLVSLPRSAARPMLLFPGFRGTEASRGADPFA